MIKIIPHINNIKPIHKLNINQNQIHHIKPIIQSITPSQPNHPHTLNLSPKKPIPKPSPPSLQQLNTFIKQFNHINKIIKQFSPPPKRKKPKPKHIQNIINPINLPF
ncbi:hypothetical protein [Staphylococcus saprophyticus]|uniref:hypothetical protein n=1 Tax=Staphylococcus saprophyticus TaxID=29385 RepID=UPI001CDA0714